MFIHCPTMTATRGRLGATHGTRTAIAGACRASPTSGATPRWRHHLPLPGSTATATLAEGAPGRGRRPGRRARRGRGRAAEDHPGARRGGVLRRRVPPGSAPAPRPRPFARPRRCAFGTSRGAPRGPTTLAGAVLRARRRARPPGAQEPCPTAPSRVAASISSSAGGSGGGGGRGGGNAFAQHTRDLLRRRRRTLRPIVGRDGELRQLLQVIARRQRTTRCSSARRASASARSCTRSRARLAQGDDPPLSRRSGSSSSTGGNRGGAKLRGEFRRWLRAVLQAARDQDGGVILFVDELHTLQQRRRERAGRSAQARAPAGRGADRRHDHPGGVQENVEATRRSRGSSRRSWRRRGGRAIETVPAASSALRGSPWRADQRPGGGGRE